VVAVIASGISVIGVISGIILGWSARSRDMKKETISEAKDDAFIKVDMEYIKRGVDDIRVDLRSEAQKTDELAERVTRVEESAKQAHKRIDELKG
jgi:hypothetical protein